MLTPPRIFIWINAYNVTSAIGFAMDEAGLLLAHVVKIAGVQGVGPDHRRATLDALYKHTDLYWEHYPNGFTLEYCDRPKQHAGLLAAMKLYTQAGRAAFAPKDPLATSTAVSEGETLDG